MKTLSASHVDGSKVPRVWLVGAVATALCLGGAILLWPGSSTKDKPTSTKPVALTTVEKVVPVKAGTALEAVRLAKAAAEEQQRAQNKAALLTQWKREKKGLEHKVQVDLPAALARRQAGAPFYNAVIDFPGKSTSKYLSEHPDAREDFWRAMDALKSSDPKARGEYVHLETLGVCVKRMQAVADAAPIDGAGTKTLGDVAREVASLPGVDVNMQRGLAQTERQIFGDEQAAKQLESMRTNAQLNEYLQTGAQDRYVATYQQMVEQFPIESALKDYMEESFKENGMSVTMKGVYLSHWNADTHAITEDFSRWWADAYVRLGGQSGDDPEVREMLTKLKDLRQEMSKKLEAANQ